MVNIFLPASDYQKTNTIPLEQAAFVRAGLNGAFTMAQAGVDTAASLNQAQRSLITSLFGGTDSDRITKINRYLGTATGVLGFNTEVTDQNRLGPDDLVR